MAPSVEAEQRKAISVFLAIFASLGALIYAISQPKAIVWTILCFVPAGILYAYSVWCLLLELMRPYSVDIGPFYVCWALDGILVTLAFWQWLPLLILGAFPVGCMLVHWVVSCFITAPPGPPPSIPSSALLNEPASDYGTLHV